MLGFRKPVVKMDIYQAMAEADAAWDKAQKEAWASLTAGQQEILISYNEGKYSKFIEPVGPVPFPT